MNYKTDLTKKLMCAACLLCLMLFTTPLAFAVTNPVGDLATNASASGVLTPSGDHAVEYWIVKLEQYGALTVELSGPKGSTCSMTGLNGNGISLMSFTYLDETHQRFSAPNLAPGSYKIEVTSRNTSGAYTISNQFIEVTSNEGSPDTKPGKLSEAQPLELNASKNGLLGYTNGVTQDGSDSYKLLIPADGRLEIIYKGSASSKTDVFLYDAVDGIPIKGENAASNIRVVVHENISAGTYYIKLVDSVLKDGSDAYGPYTITTAFTPNPVPNDPEPNDTPKTAKAIALSKTVTGHMGYVSVSKTDTYDWYMVSIAKKGTMRVDMTTQNKLKGSISISRAVDNSTEWLAALQDTTKQKSLITPIDKPGTYLICISGNGYGAYGLKVIFASGAIGKVSPLSLSYPDITAPISLKLANRWVVNENNTWTGVWTRRGATDTFDAVWTNNQTKQVVKDIVSVTSLVDGNITLYREGIKGTYRGTLSSDHKKIIEGTCSWGDFSWDAVLE